MEHLLEKSTKSCTTFPQKPFISITESIQKWWARKEVVFVCVVSPQSQSWFGRWFKVVYCSLGQETKSMGHTGTESKYTSGSNARSDSNGTGKRMDIRKNNLQNIRGINRNKEIHLHKQKARQAEKHLKGRANKSLKIQILQHKLWRESCEYAFIIKILPLPISLPLSWSHSDGKWSPISS